MGIEGSDLLGMSWGYHSRSFSLKFRGLGRGSWDSWKSFLTSSIRMAPCTYELNLEFPPWILSMGEPALGMLNNIPEREMQFSRISEELSLILHMTKLVSNCRGKIQSTVLLPSSSCPCPPELCKKNSCAYNS